MEGDILGSVPAEAPAPTVSDTPVQSLDGGQSPVITGDAPAPSFMKSPTAESTPEEKAAYRAHLGIPDDYSNFEFSRAEDYPEELKNADPDGLKWFAKTVDKYDIPPDVAQNILNEFDEYNLGLYKDNVSKAEADKLAADETEVNSVNEFISSFGSEEVFKAETSKINSLLAKAGVSADEIKEGGYGNNIAVIKALMKVSALIGEDRTPGGSNPIGAGNVASQLEALTSGGREGAYYNANHPDHAATVAKVEALMTKK